MESIPAESTPTQHLHKEYPGPVTLVDMNRPSKLMGSAHTVMGLRCRIKRKNSEVWHIESTSKIYTVSCADRKETWI